MYTQDELNADDGPRVSLLWMTPDPLGAAAAMNGMYPGPRHQVPHSLADVTHEARRAILEDMQKTVLAVPLEAISFHFVIEGVTRAFTHQLVRNRNSAFAQESMRFAVVGDGTDGIPVMLPPSLADTKSHDEWFAQPLEDQERGITPAQRARLEWDISNEMIGSAYKRMVDAGMPAEDARGILPTNVLTRIQWVVNLRSLQNEFGKRLTTQAQFEWRRIIALCAKAIREYDPTPEIVKSLYRDGKGYRYYEQVALLAQDIRESDRWQYEAISDLFRPICYKTGKCEFMGEADRYCSIRDRVQANALIGRPSSVWDRPFIGVDPAENAGYKELIPAIHPAEWLSDAGAARRG